MRARRLALVAATALNCVIAAAWAYRAWDFARNVRRVPNLLRDEPAGSAVKERLAVIVPACNEEVGIENTVQSLLRQEGIALEIVAVDDRSVDRTGAILDRLAAGAADSPIPLRVLHITELPPSWMGKQHALARGVAQTSAPYLLFTDGDVVFRPDALRRAMRFVLNERADHFVLLPTPILRSWGERMMISAMQVYSAWAIRLWRVADPAAKDRLGVGAFNLVRREAYEAIGGFEALRMEVLEDVRLAVEIKRRGLRQRVAFGTGLATVHWASGIAGVIRNVTKNAFAAFRFRTGLALGMCVGLSTLGIVPAICFFGPLPMRLASAATAASVWTFYSAGRYAGGSSPRYALLLPPATVLLIYALLRSIAVTLFQDGVVWRGTAYPLAELRRNVGPLL